MATIEKFDNWKEEDFDAEVAVQRRPPKSASESTAPMVATEEFDYSKDENLDVGRFSAAPAKQNGQSSHYGGEDDNDAIDNMGEEEETAKIAPSKSPASRTSRSTSPKRSNPETTRSTTKRSCGPHAPKRSTLVRTRAKPPQTLRSSRTHCSLSKSIVNRLLLKSEKADSCEEGSEEDEEDDANLAVEVKKAARFQLVAIQYLYIKNGERVIGVLSAADWQDDRLNDRLRDE
ncbi:hypothetical protein FPV67DRAFT_1460820 [Lyophyllum atratum]|nr:hypothetical protein FPV67DRAFT_1460820 [Lyophyllum atratum]